MEVVYTVSNTSKLIAGVCALGVGLGATAQATETRGQDVRPERGRGAAEVEVLDRPHERLRRSIAMHRARAAYRAALEDADRAGLEPRRNLLAERRATPDGLRRAADRLRERTARAAPADGGRATAGAARAPEEYGVSEATLESIAACESGGDPGAVSADGTYRGKYQFDHGTWAAMGGSGDPAAAPEAEQDMRAAMLYAQSGSSPWPVCGA